MRLIVNPIRCDAHGLCAELLPEIVALDDWGYPIIPDGEVPSELELLARKAVAACPTLALLLQPRPNWPEDQGHQAIGRGVALSKPATASEVESSAGT